MSAIATPAVVRHLLRDQYPRWAASAAQVSCSAYMPPTPSIDGGPDLGALASRYRYPAPTTRPAPMRAFLKGRGTTTNSPSRLPIAWLPASIASIIPSPDCESGAP